MFKKLRKLKRMLTTGFNSFNEPEKLNRTFSGNVVYYHEKGNSKKMKIGNIYRKRDARSLENRIRERKSRGFYKNMSFNQSVNEEDEAFKKADEEYMNIIINPGPKNSTQTRSTQKQLKIEKSEEEEIELKEDTYNNKKIELMRTKSNLGLISTNPSYTRSQSEKRNLRLKTLSVFSQPTEKFDNIRRPFSRILRKDIVKYRRNNELRELRELKKKLNLLKVQIPYKTLENAILTPESHNSFIDRPLDPKKIKLPKAGALLLQNPVFQNKKKR